MQGNKPVPNTVRTAQEQRNMVLAPFFDEDVDAEDFLALVDHAGIDLKAAHGDVKQIPNIIAAHYRIAKGRYDIDRVANDLLTFPPIAASIRELQAKKRAKR
jgi:hypothetical protein